MNPLPETRYFDPRQFDLLEAAGLEAGGDRDLLEERATDIFAEIDSMIDGIRRDSADGRSIWR